MYWATSAVIHLTCWLGMTFGIWRTIRNRMSGLFGGPALHLADPFLHLFARLERYNKLFGHKHFVAGSGIASLACGPPFYLENTEISKFDAVVFDERFDDRVEGLLDDFLGLELRQSDLLGNGFDNLFLGHFVFPWENWPRM